MNAKEALDYLYQATVVEPTVADERAEEAIAVIRVYIDELWEVLSGFMELRTSLQKMLLDSGGLTISALLLWLDHLEDADPAALQAEEAVMTRKERLRARAVKLGPAAMGNYRDALHDLLFWPEHRRQILDDLDRALDAHEALQAEPPKGEA